jgi:hypothetical protein
MVSKREFFLCNSFSCLLKHDPNEFAAEQVLRQIELTFFVLLLSPEMFVCLATRLEMSYPALPISNNADGRVISIESCARGELNAMDLNRAGSAMSNLATLEGHAIAAAAEICPPVPVITIPCDCLPVRPHMAVAADVEKLDSSVGRITH